MINMKDLIKKQGDIIRRQSGMEMVTEKKEMPPGLIKIVSQMTARNNHTEARWELAKRLKNKKLAKFYQAMSMLNDVFNGYPPAASKLNQMMEKELYRQLNRTYSNYEEIYKAL